MAVSLWNDTFTIVFTLSDGVYNGKTWEEKAAYTGSLKSAIRHAFNKHPAATADFYTSEGYWLKQIWWY
ncbi:hypothetical protein P8825_15050 [Shouchella clausii]|uniref:hypothetical protein n=1 Tax=Shouchella clausii TaxID=79880 RepID=UPI002DBF1F9A|nr:hypothetical protein [Shouchella clausii]MEB5480881.1 hypothetical protein [Shouchella clausii]